MGIKIVAADPAKAPHVIHHLGRTYTVDNDGEYDINSADVPDMQKHGLIKKAPAELKT